MRELEEYINRYFDGWRINIMMDFSTKSTTKSIIKKASIKRALKSSSNANISDTVKNAFLLCLLSFGSVHLGSMADTLAIGQQTQYEAPKPYHGQSMQQVESTFGEPMNRTQAVGDPPITRWHYAGFTVYFEHDKVIHSVTHRT